MLIAFSGSGFGSPSPEIHKGLLEVHADQIFRERERERDRYIEIERQTDRQAPRQRRDKGRPKICISNIYLNYK